MAQNTPKSKKPSSSWEPVEKWYNNAVGEEGHYYHKQIILPGVLRLLDFKGEKQSILDLACGQGVLGRYIPNNIRYHGIDIAPSLINAASKQDSNPKHQYSVSDATKPLPIKGELFSHAAIILALQNIEHPNLVFANVAKHLETNGKFIIVLNHPCYRIPRQSSWGVDDAKKIQYRRMDRYLSALKIPIQTHPSKAEKSSETWSFHYPISSYSKWLKETGFVIEVMEEWCSDKVSEGGAAKMENRSREEFPLFLTILAKKL